ncbi:MAG: hypothetical protein IJC39_04190 [Firmicutes bacterium]|nr:hypothetical protein [Bacillota bacterium]
MVNNRNAAWTFIFSLLPGAGQMYLGAMRKGIVLMVFFFFWIMISLAFNADVLILFGVVVWCYSFFDVINTKRLSIEEFKAREEEFLKKWESFFKLEGGIRGMDRRFWGKVVVIIGILALLSGIIKPLLNHLNYYFQIYFDIPRLIMPLAGAILIIYIGIKIMRSEPKDFQP